MNLVLNINNIKMIKEINWIANSLEENDTTITNKPDELCPIDKLENTVNTYNWIVEELNKSLYAISDKLGITLDNLEVGKRERDSVVPRLVDMNDTLQEELEWLEHTIRYIKKLHKQI